MANRELFDEEHEMVRMTFGEHLEDLRRRIILALLGFALVVPIGLAIGHPLMDIMVAPVEAELEAYDRDQLKQMTKAYEQKVAAGEELRKERIPVRVTRETLRQAVRETFPGWNPPADGAGDIGAETREPNAPPDQTRSSATNGQAQSTLDGLSTVSLDMWVDHDLMVIVTWSPLTRRLGMISLRVEELFMAWLKVSLLAGLVIASPWVIYHLWAFVAEGLYRHERGVVYRAMPPSILLFLAGVLFCFFVVLPVVIRFFFGFNRWFNIPPNIRVTEWLGFATLLPVIFGLCFELPLVMLVLESVGIFRVEDYISRWRHAILIISIVAMVVTPTTDPGSMMLLMGPMAGLYFLGIGLVMMRRGQLRSMSPLAKLRAGVGVVVSLYLSVVSIGFAFPDRWLSHDWWMEAVWRPMTLPTSWVLRNWLESPSANWMWGVTVANAGALALILLRGGELVLRIRGRKA